jgi:DNA-binding transcriptional ArsR family regulator
MKKAVAKIDSENIEPLSEVRVAESVPNNLDKVIHERMRLGITSALAANQKLSFTELKKLLDTTDGNISVHARKLEDAGYVTCEKSFNGRVPLTEYAITADGREALERYLNHMEALISAMKSSK